MLISKYDDKTGINVCTFEYSYFSDFLDKQNLLVNIVERPPKQVYGEEYFWRPYNDVTDRWHFQATIFHKDFEKISNEETGIGSTPKRALVNLIAKLEGRDLLIGSGENLKVIEVGKFYEIYGKLRFLWDLVCGKRRPVYLKGA